MLCNAVKPDDHRRAVRVVGSSHIQLSLDLWIMSHTAFHRLNNLGFSQLKGPGFENNVKILPNPPKTFFSSK